VKREHDRLGLLPQTQRDDPDAQKRQQARQQGRGGHCPNKRALEAAVLRRGTVRRSRDGGPEIRALIAAAVPWLARAMAAETRLLIGHTSLCAAAAAVRTPMIAHALVLHSRHRWKGDWRRPGVGARTRAAVRCLEAQASPLRIYLRSARLRC
jgi:hypothetical protein